MNGKKDRRETNNNNKKEGGKTSDKFWDISSQKHLIALFLILFISLVLIRNIYFIKQDTGPEQSDNQYIKSIFYYRVIMFDEPINLRSLFYPPVGYLTAQLFYLWLGPTVETSRLSMSIFVVIFLLAMFGIGYELGDAFSGIAVMSLAASSPFILNLSVKYMLDFPCAAMVAASLYFLLKTDYFRNKKYTLIFGACFGLALLTKNFVVFYLTFPIFWYLLPNIKKSWRSFFIFLLLSIPPLAMFAGSLYYVKLIASDSFNIAYIDWWFLYYAGAIVLPWIILLAISWQVEKRYKNNEDADKDAISGLINFSHSFSIFTVLPMLWYFWAARANIFYFNLQRHDQELLLGKGSYKLFLYSAIFNLNHMIVYGFNFSIFLIAMGFIYLIIKREHLYRNLLIPLGFAFSAFIMLGTLHHQFRYILPLLIFIIIIAGYWVAYTGRFKPFLTFLIAGVSLASILIWVPLQPTGKLFLTHDPTPEETSAFPMGIIYPYSPNPREIYTDEMLKFMFPRDQEGTMKRIIYFHSQHYEMQEIYYIQGEALKQEKIIKLIEACNYNEGIKLKTDNQEKAEDSNIPMKKRVDFIVSLYKDKKLSSLGTKSFNQLEPGTRYEEKTFKTSNDGYYMKISRIVK